MKRWKAARSASIKALGALAVGVLALGGASSAALAADELQSTLTLYPQGCYTEGGAPVLIEGAYGLADYEGIDTVMVEGALLPGDAEYRLYPGTYDYSYRVFNGDLGTEAIRTSSFTVETCTDTAQPIVAVAPTQDGQNVTIPVVEGVEYFDTATDGVLSGTVQVPNGGQLVVGARPGDVFPITGGPWTFTWTAPDPGDGDPGTGEPGTGEPGTGNPGDGNAGGDNGSTPGGNTDGTNPGNNNSAPKGSTDNGTTVKVAPPAAQTGDTVASGSPFGLGLMGAGALMIALLAAFAVKTRKSAAPVSR